VEVCAAAGQVHCNNAATSSKARVKLMLGA
jgi:hypothetical protein